MFMIRRKPKNENEELEMIRNKAFVGPQRDLDREPSEKEILGMVFSYRMAFGI